MMDWWRNRNHWHGTFLRFYETGLLPVKRTIFLDWAFGTAGNEQDGRTASLSSTPPPPPPSLALPPLLPSSPWTPVSWAGLVHGSGRWRVRGSADLSVIPGLRCACPWTADPETRSINAAPSDISHKHVGMLTQLTSPPSPGLPLVDVGAHRHTQVRHKGRFGDCED